MLFHLSPAVVPVEVPPVPGRLIPRRRAYPGTVVVIIIVLTFAGWPPEQIITLLIVLGVVPATGMLSTGSQ